MSLKALRALNATVRYLFISFLKIQMRQTKNWSSEKSHEKKTDRTNIIAIKLTESK